MSVAGQSTASESEPGTLCWTFVATAPMMPSPGASVLARATIICTPYAQAVDIEDELAAAGWRSVRTVSSLFRGPAKEGRKTESVERRMGNAGFFILGLEKRKA